MAGQPERVARQFAERQLETRIMAQGVEIVGAFIPARDRQHTGTRDVGDPVDHSTLIARISDAGGEPIRDPNRRSACASRSTPPAEVSRPPSNAAVIFRPRMAGKVKANPLSSAMAVVALSVWSRGMA